jgi:hypothetical protein
MGVKTELGVTERADIGSKTAIQVKYFFTVETKILREPLLA